MRIIKTTSLLGISALVLAGCAAAPATESSTAPEAQSSSSLESPETNGEQTDFSSEDTEDTAAVEGSSSDELSDAEVILAALMGPDGEYAALASYQAVLDEFGQVEPYATILEAETRHANALIRQLERLGVDVPENRYLGEIAAPADLQTAAGAWAEGEILNVELYDYLLTQTDDPQILKVLGNLRTASLESHMPAFQAAAETGGTLESMPTGGHSS